MTEAEADALVDVFHPMPRIPGMLNSYHQSVRATLRAAIMRAAQLENEGCAQIADEAYRETNDPEAEGIAEDIRERMAR